MTLLMYFESIMQWSSAVVLMSVAALRKLSPHFNPIKIRGGRPFFEPSSFQSFTFYWSSDTNNLRCLVLLSLLSLTFCSPSWLKVCQQNKEKLEGWDKYHVLVLSTTLQQSNPSKVHHCMNECTMLPSNAQIGFYCTINPLSQRLFMRLGAS